MERTKIRRIIHDEKMNTNAIVFDVDIPSRNVAMFKEKKDGKDIISITKLDNILSFPKEEALDFAHNIIETYHRFFTKENVTVTLTTNIENESQGFNMGIVNAMDTLEGEMPPFPEGTDPLLKDFMERSWHLKKAHDEYFDKWCSTESNVANPLRAVYRESMNEFKARLDEVMAVVDHLRGNQSQFYQLKK